jgi:hypothetical protein
VGPTAGQDVFLGNFLPLTGIKPWIAQPIVSSLHRFGYIINYEPSVRVSVHYINQDLTKDVVTQLDDVNFMFYILLTVHLDAILGNDQLDALFLNVFVYASTRFEHQVLIIRRAKLY